MNPLREIIVQEIRERGPIPFSRYMELCLYHPDHGYYSRNVHQFGKAGDFYTSSDIHAVFGRLMARQFEQMWRVLGSPNRIEIIELGPGRGLFARDVLDWAEKKFPEFFQALVYALVERSAALRARLQDTFANGIEAGKARIVEAIDAVPLSAALPTIIFANEFFDALPVEIIGPAGSLRVSEEGGRLFETWAKPSPEELQFVDQYGVHPESGERIEVPLLAQREIFELANFLKQGFLVTIDYGYTRQEQLAGRHRGTLMTYRHHSAGNNPYEAPGEQDITSHVNFTALSAAAEQHNLQVQPLITQSQFLMGIGEDNQFADVFEDCRLPQERAKVALQLKHLITPAGIGETFHVLVASKGVPAQRAASLSGLNFGKAR